MSEPLSFAWMRPEEKQRFLDSNGQVLSRFLLAQDSAEWLAVGSDPTWALWSLPEPLDVRVRLNVAGPRVTVTGVAALGRSNWGRPPDPVRALDLRSIPLGRLEDVLNDYRLAWALSEALGRGELNFDPGVSARLDDVLELPAAPAPEPDFKIEGVGADARPTEFYVAVAAAWATAIANRQKEPAGVIAEANAVPISTVHRWVREARRRQVMAPSSRAIHAERRDRLIY